MEKAAVEEKNLEMAETLIANLSGDFIPDEYADEYAQNLKEIIRARTSVRFKEVLQSVALSRVAMEKPAPYEGKILKSIESLYLGEIETALDNVRPESVSYSIGAPIMQIGHGPGAAVWESNMQSPPGSHPRDKRLLVVHQGALGDFIVTFPLLLLLRSLFARVDAVCRSSFGPLALHLGVIDAYRPVEAAGFATFFTDAPSPEWGDWLGSYHRLLLFSFSEELAQRLRRVAGEGVRRIPPWPRGKEQVQVTQYLWRHLLALDLMEEEEKKVRLEQARPRVFSEPAPGPVSKRILLGPGAGSSAKRWPLHCFIGLAELMAQRNFEPTFVLGPLEADIEMQLTRRFRSPFPLAKPENLIGLADLLKTVDGYVGNDSAVGHLAAFMGRPTVIVFGPSDANCWMPFGRAVGIVRAAVDCRPCGSAKSAACEPRNCLQSISPQRVWDTFADVVAGSKK
jgi:ADP-heptose:LPS heptosyltransferase